MIEKRILKYALIMLSKVIGAARGGQRSHAPQNFKKI